MLMYHSILAGAREPTWPWAVSLGRFRAQLNFLADEGWTTMTMGELARSPAPPPPRSVVITFDDGYVDNLAAFEELRRRGMRATWFMVSGSLGAEPSWSADGRPASRLLNGAELREMRAAGMEIGSHTASHARLTQTDDTCLRAELVDSKSTLEDVLGAGIVSFAYPYGAWDVRCEAAVRAAGYACACTTRTGWALADANPYRYRRLTVFNTDTAASLARKLVFASHEVSWLALAGYWKRRLLARLGGAA